MQSAPVARCPETAERLGFRSGDLVEYVPDKATPLRAWVKIMDGIAVNETAIGPVGASILSLRDGDLIRIRPLPSFYSHPPIQESS